MVALSMKQKLASSLCDGTWLARAAASAAKVVQTVLTACGTLCLHHRPPKHLL